MLIRGMVCHKIHQDPDPPFLRFCNQLLHIVHVSKTGINIHVVRHIISIICHGRWENRTQPDHICSQRRDLIQMPDHTLQIPDSVSVGIQKALGINLIGHLVMPPFLFHNHISFYWFRRLRFLYDTVIIKRKSPFFFYYCDLFFA